MSLLKSVWQHSEKHPILKTKTRQETPSHALRIGLVIPWYGKLLGGGAESASRSLVQALKEHRPDIKVDVLTTALKEFSTDWNQNFYEEAICDDDGIDVYRFKAEPINRSLFHKINLRKLMPQTVDDLWRAGKPHSPLSIFEEWFYMRHMVHSQSLYRYLRACYDDYDFFVFIPYMFGTTYKGSLQVPGKAIIIPCLHNERYAYMRLYRNMMNKARAVFFHVEAERRLANRIYQIPQARQFPFGVIVDINPPKGDLGRFRSKFNIQDPFVLYAGRKIEGKGLPTLVQYFLEYKKNAAHSNKLKLVIIGKGDLQYPREQYPDIIDLGFVSDQDKHDAYTSALCLAMPSLMESFSIVLMESWLQGVPVLVNELCEVTRDHAMASNGGYSYRDAATFSAALQQFLTNPGKTCEMGMLGRQYVIDNYSAKTIVNKFAEFVFKLKNS